MLPVVAAFVLAVEGRPPQTVRAPVAGGHVLAPLRLLAEALGADVRWDGAARSVVLRRGARTAVVTAPRTIDGRAYVPLRVAAAALDVQIRYDPATRTIAVAPGAAAPASASASTTPSPVATVGASVVGQLPAPGTRIDQLYPTISAHVLAGSAALVPGSLALTLDGVTLPAAPSPDAGGGGFVVAATPHSALAPGDHLVRIDGRDATGTSFTQTWAFVETARISRIERPSIEALASAYLTRIPSRDDRFFDVYAYGAPGGTGFVTIDGVPGAFPLVPAGGWQGATYVAHVGIPDGVNARSTHVRVHVTPAIGYPIDYVIPTEFSIDTTPLAAATATPGSPVPRPRRTATPAPTPTPTSAPRKPVRRQPAPRSSPTASPSSTVPS